MRNVIFRSRTKEFMAVLEEEIDKAVTESAEAMAGNIKAITPVDTGRLRNSITASSHLLDGRLPGGEGEVGTNVEYAPYVEYGTRFQKPQPYMRRGAENSVPTANRIFKERMSRLQLESEVVRDGE